MDTPVLSSTAFLTVLLAIGLLFFIRASAKDRTEVAKLVTDQSQDSLLENLRHYFLQRAYRVVSLDADRNQVVFEGFVRPSWFLAIFLSVLAAIGIFCLSLVLAILFPSSSSWLSSLVLLSPLAGWFYWQKSGRTEQVSLQIESPENAETPEISTSQPRSVLTVTAHRDELAELQRQLQLHLLESH